MPYLPKGTIFRPNILIKIILLTLFFSIILKPWSNLATYMYWKRPYSGCGTKVRQYIVIQAWKNLRRSQCQTEAAGKGHSEVVLYNS